MKLLAVLAIAACERAGSVPTPPPPPPPVPVPAPPPKPVPLDASTVPAEGACRQVMVGVDPTEVAIEVHTEAFDSIVTACAAPITDRIPAGAIRTALEKVDRAMARSCKRSIMLFADAQIAYAQIIEVMDAARASGFADVLFSAGSGAAPGPRMLAACDL